MNIPLNKVLVIFLVCSASAFAESLSNSLPNTKEWESFISGIEQGKTDFILHAIELRKKSDAGISSELNDALFIALQHQPATVLSGGLAPCNGRSDPAPTYNVAIKEVNAAIKAVSTINSEQATKCKSALQNSKLSLAKFFGVAPNGL